MVANLEVCEFQQDVKHIYHPKKSGVCVVTIGKRSYVITASLGMSDDGNSHLLIGNYSSIAHNVIFLIGINHNYSNFSTYPFDQVAKNTGAWKMETSSESFYGERNRKQIVIGHDVWIGANVTIIGGVRIGNGAVIGAGAVVTKDVPPYAIVVGNPMRIIKYRFSTDIINKFQQIKWWNWESEKIQEALPLLDNVDIFLQKYHQTHNASEQNALSQEIVELHQQYEFYHLRPDIHTQEQVWRRFISRYVQKENAQKKKILLLWLDESPEAAQCAEEVKLMLDAAGNDAPAIMTYQGDTPVMQSVVPHMDVIVTTKGIESLDILDSVGRDDVKWLYANDY